MNRPTLLDLLRDRIGLDPSSLGVRTVEAAISSAMTEAGLSDRKNYEIEIARRSDLFANLVDRLIVPETWFFRGTVFRRLPELIRNRPTRPVRILCAPCSTGEEPYSVAISLIEAGLSPGEFEITGVDISPRSIEAARIGRYRDLAFRQTEAAVRSRYFIATGDTWQLDSGIRKLVAFSVANLVQLGDADCQGPFDVIFCRNLMIYLTPESRKQLLSSLESRLADDGWLAVGPAEPASLIGRGYTAWGDDADFLFRRGPSTALAPPVSTNPPRPTVRPTSTTPLRTTLPMATAIPRETWADARHLADAGRLDDALAACHRIIARDGHSAEGYALLGIIQHARGDLDAADAAFRSALYLDPDQTDALTHGALLCDRRGQSDRAASLRDRLGRLRATGGGA